MSVLKIPSFWFLPIVIGIPNLAIEDTYLGTGLRIYLCASSFKIFNDFFGT